MNIGCYGVLGAGMNIGCFGVLGVGINIGCYRFLKILCISIYPKKKNKKKRDYCMY